MYQKHSDFRIRRKKRTAFTLVECMVVMLILMITISGIMGFRYYSIINAQRAETQLLAARAASVLSEAWKAGKGTDSFDPVQQGFDSHFQIQPYAGFVPINPAPFGSILLGNYDVTIDGRQFQASLLYQSMWSVPNARVLYVVMTWQDDGKRSQQYYLSTITRT